MYLVNFHHWIHNWWIDSFMQLLKYFDVQLDKHDQYPYTYSIQWKTSFLQRTVQFAPPCTFSIYATTVIYNYHLPVNPGIS